MLPEGRWINGRTPAQAAKEMRAYFASLLPVGAGAEPLKASGEEEPDHWEGFPSCFVEVTGGSGQNRSTRLRGTPEELHFNVFFLDLAAPEAGEMRSGRHKAKDTVLDLLDLFIVALAEGPFGGKVRDYRFASWDTGPIVDRLGRRVAHEGSIVYSLRADLRVEP